MNEMNTKLSQDQKKELNLPFTMEEMCKAVSTLKIEKHRDVMVC